MTEETKEEEEKEEEEEKKKKKKKKENPHAFDTSLHKNQGLVRVVRRLLCLFV